MLGYIQSMGWHCAASFNLTNCSLCSLYSGPHTPRLKSTFLPGGSWSIPSVLTRTWSHEVGLRNQRLAGTGAVIQRGLVEVAPSGLQLRRCGTQHLNCRAQCLVLQDFCSSFWGTNFPEDLFRSILINFHAMNLWFYLKSFLLLLIFFMLKKAVCSQLFCFIHTLPSDDQLLKWSTDISNEFSFQLGLMDLQLLLGIYIHLYI